MPRIICIALTLLLIVPSISSAEIKNFTHTVKQPFAGSQSPDDARVAAIHKAKREVLEKAGTYLESMTIVKNSVVEKDEILALAAGVLKAEVVSQENFATKEAFGIVVVEAVNIAGILTVFAFLIIPAAISTFVQRSWTAKLITGWIMQVRNLGGLKFLQLQDRTGIIQIVLPKKKVDLEIFDVDTPDQKTSGYI